MSLQTSFWTIKPAGNGILYSGYPAGNPPTPTWTAVPNYLNQTQSFIVDIPLTFVTPSSASVTLHGSLPTGWTWTGTDLEYNGTSVNASPTTGLYFTATYLGQSVNSNTFSVQGQGSSSSDTIAPTIPTGLVATANSVSGGITIGGFTPADPNPVGQTATGLGQINVLRNSGSLGTATIPSPGAPGNLTTLTLTDIGGPFSPASTMTYSGADIVVTTVARDPSYPTTDGQALPYQQISGTSWIAWCEVSTFSPANAYDNVNIQARPTLTDNAAYVGVGTHSFAGGVGVFSEARASTGASLSNIQTLASSASPVWLYLIRSADTYSMYYSLNGNTLLSLGSTTQVMGSTLYVGFPVNTNDGVSITVTIQQCTIQTLGNWSYTDTTVTPGTTYTYSASSQDTIPNVSAASPTISVTAASTGNVRWNPGHYGLTNTMILPGTSLTAQIQPEVNMVLSGGANVKGYAMAITWACLEPTEGTYVWTAIDQVLTWLAGSGKLLIIQLAAGAISSNPANCVPGYILNGSQATWGNSPNSGQAGWWNLYGTYCLTAYWRPAIATRLAALFTACGERYNSNPMVEMIGIYDETAESGDVSGSDCTVSNFTAAQHTWMVAAVAACPNTNVTNQINFMVGDQIINCPNCLAIFNDAFSNRVTMGGPDMQGQSGVPGNLSSGQNCQIGTATGSTARRGQNGYIQCVQGYATGAGDYTYTPQDIMNCANDTLFPDHILWSLVPGTSGSGAWSASSPNGVLATINSNPIPQSSYPTTYPT